MFPLTDPEDCDEATRLINLYASSDWCALSFSQHGLQRKEERLIPSDVITKTLQVGVVVGVRSEVSRSGRRLFKYEVEMVDRYGRVTVITAIPGRLKLHIVSTFTDIPD